MEYQTLKKCLILSSIEGQLNLSNYKSKYLTLIIISNYFIYINSKLTVTIMPSQMMNVAAYCNKTIILHDIL